MPAGLGRPSSSMEGPCLQMMLSLWGPPSLGPREAAFLRSQQFYFAQLSLFPRVVLLGISNVNGRTLNI